MEPGQRAAPGDGQAGLDVRDFTLTTFGGSGSLLACRLIDILDLAASSCPPNPGNVSAFGLLTVDVRNDYVQTAVAKHADLDLGAVRAIFADLTAGAKALDGEGFAARRAPLQRTADLRYFGQAFEVRVPAADGEVDAARRRRRRRLPRRPPPALRLRLRHDPRQEVEWVNLRVTGIGPIRRPDMLELGAADGGTARAVTGTRRVFFDDWVDVDTDLQRPDLAPATSSPVRPSSRSSAPRCRSTPASSSASTPTATSCSRRRRR